MIENWPILSILIFLPIFGALLILLIPNKIDQEGKILKNSITNIKLVSLWTSIMTFLMTLLLSLKFNYNEKQYQFLEFYEWVPSLGIVYRVGLDGLSLPFILLTAFLVPICILCSWNTIQHKIKEFMISFLILEAFIIGMFSALDIVVFYIFFEAVLIPMFLIIGIWPILMGLTMWIQQKLNPAPPDPIQAKIFMFFPFFLTILLASFPSGLVVYWTINNVLTMAQQYVIIRKTKTKTI